MVQSFLDHGTREEINAVGTLVGKMLPVYFPQLSFREDGCEIINIGNSMAVISGDGTGISEEEDSVVAFEFKCPVPGKTYTTDIQYKIPTHYTTQILGQMAVKKCKSLVFISYTHESASYIHADINSNLWEQTKTFAEELYGTDNPPRPTRRNPNSKTLLADLKTYSDTCSFMVEFPLYLYRLYRVHVHQWMTNNMYMESMVRNGMFTKTLHLLKKYYLL
ncbi:unnamed protein product [Mytilus coruscus]|uniref:YqaJ viral recombinase domain-containing protein n=1 Tax=Mytilus coruscus TaxID=42192 RepID=A0A6J8CZ16_MYTCO|nr:unnamed protein product [Mytilus coruscus]